MHPWAVESLEAQCRNIHLVLLTLGINAPIPLAESPPHCVMLTIGAKQTLAGEEAEKNIIHFMHYTEFTAMVNIPCTGQTL